MDDDIKQRGASKSYKDDRGSGVLYPHPIIGIVKNNIDPTRTGRIQVYLERLNGPDENVPDNWTTVRYLSPFFGITPNTGSPDDYGTYVGNRNSYGFWATPPDIGTKVVCVFINGLPGYGYYIGGVPPESLTHMVPAIGASNNVIPNEGEATGYAGATRLPVTEFNDDNKDQENSPTPSQNPRPVHSYQAAILNKQGLIRDPDRGAISSSSMRESPSRVFGMSTPGRPIYEGGYDDVSIGSAASSASDTNLKIIGRTGGHSIVMDDGDVQGRDQLTRIRTSSGHMIMMNDYAQTLFIIHANGQSYIELGKEGTIDMFSTNSVNIRTMGDLNLHADKNININAMEDLNISAKNIKSESIEATSQLVGTTYKHQTKGDYTAKINGKMSFASGSDASVKSGGTVYVNGGPNILLNTGSSSLQPQDVKQIPITTHADTLQDNEKGFIPAPGKLPSIVSRAPAHSPWINANQGVDVKTNLNASASLPSNPTPSAAAAASATNNNPVKVTSPALASTSPVTKPATQSLDATTSGALVSQMALNAANSPALSAVQQTAGVVNINGQKTAAIGPLAINPQQMVAAGTLKPGVEVAVTKNLLAGKDIASAIPPVFFTGKDGITNAEQFVNSLSAQTNVATALLKQGESALKSTGIITGKESATQSAGLILSAATAGVAQTVNFVKGISKDSAISDPAGAASVTMNAIKNGISSPADLIAAGNKAASMAQTSLGTLSGAGIIEGAKGTIAGVFNKIKDSYKALTAGVPQVLGNNTATPTPTPTSLATAATGTTGTKTLGDTLSSTFGGVTGAISKTVSQVAGMVGTAVDKLKGIFTASNQGVPSVSGLPAGASSVSNVVTAVTGAGSKVAKELTSTVDQIVKSVPSGLGGVESAVNALGDNLKSKGISAVAATGLDPNVASEIEGAVSSIGKGGPVEVKAPTVATDTFDISGLEAQSKALLGNPKIPPLQIGASKVPPQT